MELRLVKPDVAHRDTFLRALRAFREEGLPWHLAVDLEAIEHDFASFVAAKLADAHLRTETTPPKTHLWALVGDECVGRISIFHELTDALRVEGGHIGYDTVPSSRGRGVATEMLRQVLPVACALGLGEVLLTCDDTNAASIRVIEKCGGVLRAKKILAAGRPAKRYYWIALASPRDARARA